MRNIFLSLILSMVACQISEATQAKFNYGPALIVASKTNDIPFVRVLLKNKNNDIIRDEDIWMALMWASLRDNIEVVRLLLENGADVNHPKEAISILDYERHFSEDMIRLLATAESMGIYGPGL